MNDLIAPLLVLLRLQASQLHAAFDARRTAEESDAGLGTLEMAIIALGLMAIAGLLIAVLTSAVTSRTNNIK